MQVVMWSKDVWKKRCGKELGSWKRGTGMSKLGVIAVLTSCQMCVVIRVTLYRGPQS